MTRRRNRAAISDQYKVGRLARTLGSKPVRRGD